jgi:hypothetical protein
MTARRIFDLNRVRRNHHTFQEGEILTKGRSSRDVTEGASSKSRQREEKEGVAKTHS